MFCGVIELSCDWVKQRDSDACLNPNQIKVVVAIHVCKVGAVRTKPSDCERIPEFEAKDLDVAIVTQCKKNFGRVNVASGLIAERQCPFLDRERGECRHGWGISMEDVHCLIFVAT